MFLKDSFQELVLLSLKEGVTRLDDLLNTLSIFSKESIVKELVSLHNSKVIEFDIIQFFPSKNKIFSDEKYNF